MKDIATYYDEHAKSFSESSLNLDMRFFYPYFLRNLKEKSRVLDAGCGTGRDAKAFQEYGLDVVALDASAEFCKLAATALKKPVHHMRYEEMNFEKEFEAIWACASLIHIPEDELKDLFKKFIKALKVGGIWFFSFHYGIGEVLRNGISRYYYNEASMKKLLRPFKELRILKIWKTESCDSSQPKEWLCTLVRRLW